MDGNKRTDFVAAELFFCACVYANSAQRKLQKWEEVTEMGRQDNHRCTKEHP